MKTTQHEFSLELYNKAIANPDKYEFVYRDGTNPLGVVYMEGLMNEEYSIISWSYHHKYKHSVKKPYVIGHEQPFDLFILEKHALTYRSALESLPDGYRELALENAEKQGWRVVNPNDECVSIFEPINRCFDWEKTTQGSDFWFDVYKHYKKGSTIPPLPVKEEKETVAESEKVDVPKVDKERLDKFVCAFIKSGSNPEDAVRRAKETLKQLEGGEG